VDTRDWKNQVLAKYPCSVLSHGSIYQTCKMDEQVNMEKQAPPLMDDHPPLVVEEQSLPVVAPDDVPLHVAILRMVVHKATTEPTPRTFEPKSYDKLPAKALKSRARVKNTHRNVIKLEKKQRQLKNVKHEEVVNDSSVLFPEFVFGDDEQSVCASSLGSRYSHHTPGGRRYFGLPPPVVPDDDRSMGSRSIKSGYRKDKKDPPVALLPQGMQMGAPVIVNSSVALAKALRPQFNENSLCSNKGLDVYVDKVTKLEPIRFAGDDENPMGSAVYRSHEEWHSWSHFHKRQRVGKWQWVAVGSVIMGVVVAAIVVAVTGGGSGQSSMEGQVENSNIELAYHRATPERPKVPIPEEFSSSKGTAPAGGLSSGQVMELLDLITSAPTLADSKSPQGQAAAWLLKDVAESPPESSARVVQRYILATFAFSSALESWKSKYSWLTTDHECTWHGVKCGTDGSSSFSGTDTSFASVVTYINLQANNLQGSLPSELAHLRDLASLQIQGNSLVGSIPVTLSKLDRLHTLFLDGNFFTGGLPFDIGHLKRIQAIDVSNNSLRGKIPDSIGEAATLQDLRLTSNEFTGSFPADVSGLHKLETLLAGNNELFGTLPTNLCNLPSLIFVHIYENELSGHVPEFQSTLLEQLHLDSNALTGHIPLFKATKSLRQLRLERNKLSGTIPVHVGDNVALEQLWLFNNKLSGALPHELGRLEKLVSFRIQGNSFTGTVPNAVCDLKLYALNAFHATCDGSNPALFCSCCDEGCTE
jgi:hypothetical protein